jgi:signal peptidase II
MTLRQCAMRRVVIAAILVSCIGCDQVTKQLAQSQLKGQPPRAFCGDLLRLEYAENPGAFLGLGGELPAWVRWVTLVLVDGVIAAVLGGALLVSPGMPPVRLLACSMLLAGAVGNLIDRLRLDGLVIDFLNLGMGPLRTGIFNVADMALMLGAGLLVVEMLGQARADPPGVD